MQPFGAQAFTPACEIHSQRNIAMARSNGRAAVVAALCALVYASWLQLQLAGFVNASGSASSRALRSCVSLAAASPEVEAAFKDFQLKQWAAEKLASEGSPLAAAAAGRAQQALGGHLERNT